MCKIHNHILALSCDMTCDKPIPYESYHMYAYASLSLSIYIYIYIYTYIYIYIFIYTTYAQGPQVYTTFSTPGLPRSCLRIQPVTIPCCADYIPTLVCN